VGGAIGRIVRLLQDRFELLAPALHRFLAEDRGRAFGRLSVRRSAGRLRNLGAAALGVPPEGDYDLLLEVTLNGAGQRWTRRFGPHALVTTQIEHCGLLVESSGPGSLGFELIVEAGALLFRPRRAWVFGLPVPLWMAPNIEADNWPTESGGWRVHLRFCLPLLGVVGEYEGEVTPEGASSSVNGNDAV
jgi:Domain of unknown function (DUF4166)